MGRSLVSAVPDVSFLSLVFYNKLLFSVFFLRAIYTPEDILKKLFKRL